jgi:HlyD family secretion protein
MAKRSARQLQGLSVLLVVAVLVVVTGLVGGAYYGMGMGSSDPGEAPLIHIVKSEAFDHIVLEQGEVESSSNVEVTCNVKSRNSGGTAILWVADEGTRAKKGDKLVELDASAIDNEMKQQRIIVNSSLALKISAQSTFEQAVVAKEEYEKGTFIQEQRQIQSDILLSQETSERARASLGYSEKLQARGFVTDLQLAADEFAVLQAENQLALFESKLTTLEQITRKKMLIGFDADIETARARVDSETQSHDEEIEKLADLEEQIVNCTMFAPEDGIVVHSNKYSSRGGSAEFVVEAGAMVRERQVIVKLPDPSKMQVKAKINEARVPLVIEGMPVAIQIGALQNRTLQGRVMKVNKYAEPSSWMSSVKEYSTLVEIIKPPEEVRTGMTAEVRIFVEQILSVLQVPVQTLHEYRGHMFVLVQTGEAPDALKYETREIEIGSSNDKMVTVQEGLAVDERVVLNPRSHKDKFELPDLPDVPRVAEDVAASLRQMGKDFKPPVKLLGSPEGGPAAAGGADAMVQGTLDEFDTDKDGSLSATEISAMPDSRQKSTKRADADSDGIVTKAELTKGVQAFMSGAGRQGGGAGREGGGAGREGGGAGGGRGGAGGGRGGAGGGRGGAGGGQ